MLTLPHGFEPHNFPFLVLCVPSPGSELAPGIKLVPLCLTMLTSEWSLSSNMLPRPHFAFGTKPYSSFR